MTCTSCKGDFYFIFVILVTKLFTTGYLLIYNGVQWSGFFLILVNIILLTLKGKGKNYCDKNPLHICRGKDTYVYSCCGDELYTRGTFGCMEFW